MNPVFDIKSGHDCCRYRNSIPVIYFQINGRKSLSMSFGGLTLGTGVTRVCLYADEYLHWIILAQIILSCTTGASSSQYRLSTHPGIMSDPVAFLGFSSFKAALTRPIEGVGGFPPLKNCSASSRLGIIVLGRFDLSLINSLVRAVIQNISAKLIDAFLHDSLNMANLTLILITITVAAPFPNTYHNVNILNT